MATQLEGERHPEGVEEHRVDGLNSDSGGGEELPEDF